MRIPAIVMQRLWDFGRRYVMAYKVHSAASASISVDVGPEFLAAILCWQLGQGWRRAMHCGAVSCRLL